MKILGFFTWKSKKNNKRRIVPWEKLGGGEEVLQAAEMYSKPSRGLQKAQGRIYQIDNFRAPAASKRFIQLA